MDGSIYCNHYFNISYVCRFLYDYSGIPLYVSTISNNPALAGTMTTTLMTASLITRFFASVIIQKINMKVLLIVSLIYFLATIVLSLLNDSIGFLIFIRALQGIGFCMLTNLVSTLSSTMVPTSRLGEGLVFFRHVIKHWNVSGPSLRLLISQVILLNQCSLSRSSS